MKKLLLVVCFLGFSIHSFAQIQDAEEVVSDRTIGKTNGWKIFVPKADVKTLENSFRKWMREYKAKVERDKNSGETFAANVLIPSMGVSKYTIYNLFAETSEGGFITSFVKIGDVYVTGASHPKEAAEWARLMKKFANDLAAEIVQDELNDQEKRLDNEAKAYEKLKKEKVDYEKDIEDCEAKIVERKAQLERNASDQLGAKSKVAVEEDKVARLRDELKLYVR